MLPFDPNVAPAEKGEMKMFSHLVESDLHKGELKRKGTFFLATMIAYALVLMATGVVGVYAYEAHIDDQNLELVALVPIDTEETKSKEAKPRLKANMPVAAAATGGSKNAGGPKQSVPSNTSADETKISGLPQASTNQMPPTIGEDGNRTIGFNRGAYNPNGDGINSSPSTTGNRNSKLIDEEPPPVVKKQDSPDKKIQYIGVANGRAISLPEPAYPQIARAAGIEGVVMVEILIDEMGRVMSARATNGHPFLRPEAERAAARARFTPTTLSNQPVKAKGIITFNFVLRK
jgi:protein TonB